MATITLTTEQTRALDALLSGRDTIPADFNGFTDDEAVRILQTVYDMPEIQARERIAFVRGEYSGDNEIEVR